MIAVAGLSLDDVQQIFVVLAILYAVEVCWWLRGDVRRFFPSPFDRWSDRPPDAVASDAWRLSCSNPWPWGAAYAAEPFPVPFDHTLILLPVLDAQTGGERYESVALDALEPVQAVDREVVSGPRRLVGCCSHQMASSVADRLERLRAADPALRAAVAIELLADMWSFTAARDRLEGWQHDASTVRRLGGSLAMIGLVAGPVVYWIRDELPTPLPLAVLGAFIVLWLAAAIAGLRLRSDHVGECPLLARHRLTAFLSPASAMRLYDTAGRDVLASHEPLAVALATGARSGAQSAAEAWLRDAVFPAHRPRVSADDAPAAAALAWFRSRCVENARKAATDAGLDAASLLAAPEGGENERSYCPRCLRLFTRPATTCPGCDLPALPRAGGSEESVTA